jgi:HlyD family secretion protein
MALKRPTLIVVILLVLVGTAAGCFFLSKSSDTPAYTTAKAVRHEVRLVVSTNGIIEPVDRNEMYSPLDGFVTSIQKKEGSEILQGQPLLRLQSDQVRSALAEANAALLGAKRQARAVEVGPSKEELTELDSSIAETALQLDHQNKDLAAEESLRAKQAVSRMSVENLAKQRDLLQLRLDSLKKKKQDLLARYSTEDKELERSRVSELTKQVESLQRQLLAESVVAPGSGLIYSLQVKQGSYVSKGQLLAQIYRPGKVQLRAYVDEPDLGRIQKGQTVRIEWDGLPNQQWTGVVAKPAEQVVAMNNRSVGEVRCTIDEGPAGLIPNLNVRVEVTTARKENALMVPRSSVYNYEGKPSVMVAAGKTTAVKPVDLGFVTPEEIEILRGIGDGDLVVLNPTESGK